MCDLSYRAHSVRVDRIQIMYDLLHRINNNCSIHKDHDLESLAHNNNGVCKVLNCGLHHYKDIQYSVVKLNDLDCRFHSDNVVRIVAMSGCFRHTNIHRNVNRRYDLNYQ